MNKIIRSWYVSDDMKSEIKRCYTNDKNGIISSVKDLKTTKKTSEKSDEPYEVADIYPAYKLIMSLMLLISLYPNFSPFYKNATVKIRLNEYMRMMAAYVLYVNLFNTFCGVRMDKSWNDKIKNQYVYFFIDGEDKNVNEPEIMEDAVELLDGKAKAIYKFGDNMVELGRLEGLVYEYEKQVNEHFGVYKDELEKCWDVEECIKKLMYDEDTEEEENDERENDLIKTKNEELKKIKNEAREKYNKLRQQEQEKRAYYNSVFRLCDAIINLNNFKLSLQLSPMQTRIQSPINTFLPQEVNPHPITSIGGPILQPFKMVPATKTIQQNPPIMVDIKELFDELMGKTDDEIEIKIITQSNKLPDLIQLIIQVKNQTYPPTGIDDNILLHILEIIINKLDSNYELIDTIKNESKLLLLLEQVEKMPQLLNMVILPGQIPFDKLKEEILKRIVKLIEGNRRKIKLKDKNEIKKEIYYFENTIITENNQNLIIGRLIMKLISNESDLKALNSTDLLILFDTQLALKMPSNIQRKLNASTFKLLLDMKDYKSEGSTKLILELYSIIEILNRISRYGDELFYLIANLIHEKIADNSFDMPIIHKNFVPFMQKILKLKINNFIELMKPLLLSPLPSLYEFPNKIKIYSVEFKETIKDIINAILSSYKEPLYEYIPNLYVIYLSIYPEYIEKYLKFLNDELFNLSDIPTYLILELVDYIIHHLNEENKRKYEAIVTNILMKKLDSHLSLFDKLIKDKPKDLISNFNIIVTRCNALNEYMKKNKINNESITALIQKIIENYTTK